MAAILEAAERLLTTEGPQALNTNRVAAEAGVGVGSVYEYFGNKEDIALELIERLSAIETDAIERRLSAVPADDLEGAIDAAIEETFDLYARHHTLYDALWSMTSIVREVGRRPAEQALLSDVEERLARAGIAEPSLVAFTLFHIVESLALRFARADRWNRATGIEETARVVRAYLKERKSP